MGANGGWYAYDTRTTQNIFSRAANVRSKVGTIKSGQVLKARTPLQSDSAGKLVAHSGLSETNLVTFATITTGQTLILGGLTFTAGSGSVTAAKLVTIWSDLPAGITAANANTLLLARGINASTEGTFTAGTFGAWNTSRYSDSKVLFTSTTALTNVTNIVDSGTATDPVVVAVDGVTSFPTVVGILIYDTDASAADVDAAYFIEGAFYADAIKWVNDPATETLTKHDGTTVAVSAYSSGTIGSSTTETRRLRDKFFEGTKIVIDHITAGEKANG